MGYRYRIDYWSSREGAWMFSCYPHDEDAARRQMKVFRSKVGGEPVRLMRIPDVEWEEVDA